MTTHLIIDISAYADNNWKGAARRNLHLSAGTLADLADVAQDMASGLPMLIRRAIAEAQQNEAAAVEQQEGDE